MSDPKPRILIVDDEPDLLTVLKIGLETEGYEVLTASDGEQGLALARQIMPDLMLLDLMLPRMDGYKICRALKFDERYRRIPIFILSARSGETDRRLALELGADEFHSKPYNMRDLVARVRTRIEAARGGRSAA
jgi:DNA-binding response OmpR family regulator